MNFSDAVRSVLSQYATFTGRARRSEYWWFVLFGVLVGVVLTILDAIIGTSALVWIADILLLVPNLSVGARRLHDTDRSGWWQLIGLIPFIGVIVLIVFFCQDSKPGPNRFGDSPKYPLAYGPYGGQPPYPGAPYGQPYPGQPWGQSPYPGQPYGGQPPYPGQPWGQPPYPGQQ